MHITSVCGWKENNTTFLFLPIPLIELFLGDNQFELLNTSEMNRSILGQVQKVSFFLNSEYVTKKWIEINIHLFQLIVSTQSQWAPSRSIHASAVCLKTSSGKYKITPKRDRPLTYEMANAPYLISTRKSWNSWNCGKPKAQQIPINSFDFHFDSILLQQIYKTDYDHVKRLSKICSFGNSLPAHFIRCFAVKSLSNDSSIIFELHF